MPKELGVWTTEDCAPVLQEAEKRAASVHGGH
jgi:hypothetical protein